MAKVKMTKDIVPEDFTIGLALVDAIPVVFFGINCILMAILLENYIMLAGAVLALVSGGIKVIWKIIVVLKKKNIWWMFQQMRIGLPLGFLIILIALFIRNSWGALWQGFITMPSLVFYILGFIGMCLMGVFAGVLDSSDKKSNWIEQIDNSISQICIFIGLLIMFF